MSPETPPPAAPAQEFTAADFWDGKILSWEAGRYGRFSGAQPLLERAANWLSGSLRFRLFITGELLAPFVAGKTVLELGCGSGLLAARIMKAGALSYRGVDIADAAIGNARRLAAAEGLSGAVRFQQGAADGPGIAAADIVFSLGLFDWLGDDEIAGIFARNPDGDFLHAISEKRRSFSQLAHRVYCRLAYGFRTRGYVPRYLSVEQVAAIYRRYGGKPVYVYRHPRLSFGALVTTLPVADARPV